MKAVFGLLVLLAAIGTAVYFFGGYAGLDPNKQGADAKAAIKPGMTLAQVLDVAEPKEYHQISVQKQKSDGEEVEVPVEASAVPFRRKSVEDRVKNGDLPHGFVIPYYFSGSVAFKVYFDGTGTVTHVTGMTTMSDLLK
jgi:hypothetical protein